MRGVRSLPAIDYATASSLLQYDPTTGIIRWKKSHKIAGYTPAAKSGRECRYVQCRVNYQLYLAHRLAWLLFYGEWPDVSSDVDHINRDPHDNRISNLRLVSRKHNIRNSALWDKGGVSFCRQTGKWKAYVTIDGKQHWLGRFATEQEARLTREASVARL